MTFADIYLPYSEKKHGGKKNKTQRFAKTSVFVYNHATLARPPGRRPRTFFFFSDRRAHPVFFFFFCRPSDSKIFFVTEKMRCVRNRLSSQKGRFLARNLHLCVCVCFLFDFFLRGSSNWEMSCLHRSNHYGPFICKKMVNPLLEI